VREPARILLRLLGLLMLLVGLAAIVLLFVPGPDEVADWMGESCAHGEGGRSEQCNVGDVLELVVIAPVLILVGGVMTLALRPSARAITIDLSRRPR
jgi:hypothetical protein